MPMGTDELSQKIFKVVLQYETDQATAEQVATGVRQVVGGLDHVRDSATEARRSLHYMRMEAMVFRHVGEIFKGIGESLKGPIDAGIKSYIEGSGKGSASAKEWQASMDKIQENTSRIGKVAISMVLPTLKEMARLTGQIADFVERHPEVIKVALAAGGILTTLGTIISLVGQVKMMLLVAQHVKEVLGAGAAAEGAAGAGGATAAAGGGLAAAAGPALAVAGGVVVGAGIYDATIGKQQGQTAGSIFAQMASVFSKNVTTMTQGVEAGNKAFLDTARMYGLIEDNAGKANQQLELTAADLNDLSEAQRQSLTGFTQVAAAFQNMTSKMLERVNASVATLDPKSAQAFDEYQRSLAEKEHTYGIERQRIVDETLRNVNAIELKYHQDLGTMSYSYNTSRIDILKQENVTLTGMEKNYYKQRAAALAQFGEQVQQAEAQHAVEMQRLSQDHQTRLRKLAESRDALGVEDENESYKRERDRKEEDFQRQVELMNRQAATMLATLEQGFQEQRKAQEQATAQQLKDLKSNYNKDVANRGKQYADELAAAQQAGRDKLGQLKNQHDAEIQQINDSWTIRRRDLGIWLDGEREQFNNYMKARQQDLQKWINTAVSPGATGTSPAPVVAPVGSQPNRRASGGYTFKPTATLLAEQGREFTLNNRATQQAERILGGSLTNEKLVGALGGGGFNATVNIGPITGNNPAELAGMIEDKVYSALVRVSQQVMRR